MWGRPSRMQCFWVQLAKALIVRRRPGQFGRGSRIARPLSPRRSGTRGWIERYVGGGGCGRVRDDPGCGRRHALCPFVHHTHPAEHHHVPSIEPAEVLHVPPLQRNWGYRESAGRPPASTGSTTAASTTRLARSHRRRWKRTAAVKLRQPICWLHKQPSLYEIRADSLSPQ